MSPRLQHADGIVSEDAVEQIHWNAVDIHVLRYWWQHRSQWAIAAVWLDRLCDESRITGHCLWSCNHPYAPCWRSTRLDPSYDDFRGFCVFINSASVECSLCVTLCFYLHSCGVWFVSQYTLRMLSSQTLAGSSFYSEDMLPSSGENCKVQRLSCGVLLLCAMWWDVMLNTVP